MPTPSPSMVASVGATTGMSAKWPSSPMSPRPVTSATIAVMMGMPAATSAPKVIARITIAGGEADHLAAAGPLLGEPDAEDAARLDLQAGVPGRLGGGHDVARQLAGHAAAVHVHQHLGDGRLLVVAHEQVPRAASERAGDARDVRDGPHPPHRLLDRALGRGVEQRPLSRVEHHRALAVLLRRELPGQEVGGGLGLGAGQRDVVGRPGAQQHPPASRRRPRPRPTPAAPPTSVGRRRIQACRAVSTRSGYPSCGRVLTIRTQS